MNKNEKNLNPKIGCSVFTTPNTPITITLTPYNLITNISHFFISLIVISQHLSHLLYLYVVCCSHLV